MARILITGARGMLGSALVRSLKGKDQGECIPCGREDLDVTDREGTKSVIVNLAPDVVIHAVAFTDVDGCELDEKKAMAVNAEGTKTVAEACREVGARLLYISTDYVFDGEKGSPYNEGDPPNPINTYGRSKFRGEQYASEILPDCLIVRTSWLFGHGGDNFVEKIRNLANSQKVLSVVTDQAGCPTFAADLAEALQFLLRSGASGIVHVTNNGSCSRYEWARKIVELLGKGDVHICPSNSQEVVRPARRPRCSALDSSLFQQITDCMPRSWEDAVEAYLLSSLSTGGRG